MADREVKRPTIESLMEGVAGFRVPLTPGQRAICRAVDGVPIGAHLWADERVQRIFGGVKPAADELPKAKREAPAEIVLCAGTRTAKTMLAAALVAVRAVYADMSWWNDAESPPILPLVSVHKHNARAAYKHLRQLFTRKGSQLGRYLVATTADTLTVMHAEVGCDIEIIVTAGSASAINLESYWLASVVFDEAFKMSGRDEKVINLEDAQAAAGERVIKGGQVFYLGSPWAPDGPAFRMVRDYHGKPDARRLVMRAPGPLLNPAWWSDARVKRLEKSQDPRKREIYVTSVLAEFLDPESSLISEPEIRAVTRDAPIELQPVPGARYVAAMDPATRANAWTFVIALRDGGEMLRVVLAREWLASGKDPLNPAQVLEEIAALCRAYGLQRVWTDRWSIDAMRALAAHYGLSLIESQRIGTFELYDGIRVAVTSKQIDLPPVQQLALDLQRMTKRATADGVRISLPKTSDGRHCDYAPALGLVIAHSPWVPDIPAETPRETDEQRLLRELEARQKGNELEQLGSRL